MWSVIKKEFQVLLRDRLAAIMLLVAPAMFIVVMSLALGQVMSGLNDTEEGDAPVKIDVVDLDNTDASKNLVTALDDAAGLEVTTGITEDDANTRVADGKAALAIVIPDGFGDDAAEGAATIVQLTDPGQSNQIVVPARSAVREASSVTLATTRASAILTEAAKAATSPEQAETLSDGAKSLADIELTVDAKNAAGLETVVYPTVYQQNVPGYTVMFVFFIVTTMAGAIMRERREGTFRRLISTPLPRWKLLLGKVLPYTLVSFIQVAVLFAFGRFVFGMDLGAHPLALIPLTIALALCATSMGVALASFAKTEAQISGLGLIIILVLAALGGCMVPSVFMPEFMTKVALFTPHGLALTGYQDVLVRGMNVMDVLPTCGLLVAIAAVLWAISLPRFLTLPTR